MKYSANSLTIKIAHCLDSSITSCSLQSVVLAKNTRFQMEIIISPFWSLN
jgi:hypothetical protein